ncbi:MAG: hypothetical protein ABSC95_31600 [Acetobacteraceae bacterium]|jgi:hypothetical protein
MASLPDAAASDFLRAAGWEPGARENLQAREQLPWTYVRGAIEAAKFDKPDQSGKLQPPDAGAERAVGLVGLALGAGEWGIRDAPSGLADPARDAWKGPQEGRGKHLVSVTDGGIGLPQYDEGDLARLLQFALSTQPAIGSPPDRARVQALIPRFAAPAASGGIAYKALDPHQQGGAAQRDDWLAFTRFCEAALGQVAVQHWVLSYWIAHYWQPSLERIRKDQGAFEEVFVNARIRNSKPALASCAAQHAEGKADRIGAELEAYTTPALCGKAAKPRLTRRFGTMQRPVFVWRFVQRAAG